MEIQNFIESYQTERYDFCDRVVEKLEECIKAQDDPNVAMHYMDGATMQGGEHHRRDKAFDFNNLAHHLSEEMHEILRQHLPIYCEKYNAFSMQHCMSNEMKVQKTAPKGGFHTWHAEQGNQIGALGRNLVWTMYLNDIPDGEGETEFIEYGVKVQPKKGLLCFFPASWTHTHRGNPVYSCNKYIATGWYRLV